VTIADVNDPGELQEDLLFWADLLEMRTHVTVGVEEGLRAAMQAASAAVTV
jgi:hypothetical protein